MVQLNGSFTPKIALVSFGHFSGDFQDKLVEAIHKEFSGRVLFREERLDLSDFFDPGRRQYNGNALLREVDCMELPDVEKVLGLFSVDIFIPILTYIFGQAYLGGRSGIVSIYRLRNELYGLAPHEGLLFQRFVKVCIHELGHAYGLIHCHNTRCVMRSGTYVEDIDQKDSHFCQACHQNLPVGSPNPEHL